MSLISYAPTAFSSARLPGLAAASRSRAPLRRAGWRMPWGNTRQVVPDFFMSPSPTQLRREEHEERERTINPGEGLSKVPTGFHNHLTHEYLRFAPYALTTRLLRGVKLWSKVVFWFLATMGLWVTITGTWSAEEERLRTFLTFFLFTVVLTFPSLVGWGVSAFLMSRFFARVIRPARGPAWELSRRTGMVTLFSYRGKRVIAQSAPFHEFDAYPNPQRPSRVLVGAPLFECLHLLSSHLRAAPLLCESVGAVGLHSELYGHQPVAAGCAWTGKVSRE